MSSVKKKLKELAEIVNGGTPSTKNSEFYDGDIIWITPKDLSEQRKKYISKGERTITKLGLNSSSATLVPEGTILLSSRAPIGLTSIATCTLCTNQGFKNIVVNKEKLDNEYLYYYIKTRIKEIEALGSGTTFKEVSKSTLENYELTIPECVEEQQKIAKVLSTIDDKIELNNKINSELEAMAKELYEYWFVQFDFPDENGKPYKSSGGKMVWSEELKREIPEGWEVKKAKDICPVVTGKEDANFSTPNGEYKFFTCSQDTLRCDTPAFEGKSILIAGNGVFNVKYYNGMFNAYQRTYVLIPDDEKYVGVLYLVSKDLIDSFTKKSAGSIVKFITKGDVEGITLLDPHNDKLLNQINSIIETIAHNIEENDKLSELRDFLLPMLMNGQVTVR